MKFFDKLIHGNSSSQEQQVVLNPWEQKRIKQEEYRIRAKNTPTIWEYANIPVDTDTGIPTLRTNRLSVEKYVLAEMMRQKIEDRAEDDADYAEHGRRVDELITQATSRGWQEFSEFEQQSIHSFAVSFAAFERPNINIFLELYGEDGLRILSLDSEFTYEKGGVLKSNSGRLLEYATRVRGARDNWFFKVFKVHARLLDAISNLDSHLIKMGIEDIDKNSRRDIVTNLRQRALNLLQSTLNTFGTSSGISMDLMEQIEQQATVIITDIAVLVDVVKVLKKSKDINTIKDISAVEVHTIDSKEVLKDVKLMDSIEEIYKFNYKDKAGVLIERLRQLMENKVHKTSLHLLTYGDEVLSFMIVKYKDKDTVELTALNAQKLASSISVGTEMLRSVINHYLSEGKKVTAVASKAHARHYIKAWGFVDIGTEIFEATGEEVVRLVHESSV